MLCKLVPMPLNTMKNLLYLVCFLGSWKLLANPINHLDQISLNEGLSQSEVRAIIQDSQGYMWFGTQDGLNRYDGFEIKQFHNDPFDKKTLPGDEITSLYEDSEQRLWVGTLQGVCLYDKTHDNFIRYSHLTQKPKLAWSSVITSMVEDDWHTLWVGTYAGLWRLIPDSSHSTSYSATYYGTDQGLTHESILDLHKDKNGDIWVATPAGLNRILIGLAEKVPARQSITFENAATSVAGAFQVKTPFQRIISTDRQLWLSARGRLFAVDLEDLCIHEVSDQLKKQEASISALQIDRTGILWIGTYGNGIFRYQVNAKNQLQLLEHIQEERSQPNGLKSGTIYSLFEGHDVNEDIVWIGTREAGVHLYSRSKNSFYQWGNLLSTDRRAMEASVFSICTDSFGYLWVGTYQGLFRIHRKTQELKKYLFDKSTPANNVFTSILEDSNQNLWVGSTGGLHVYNRSTGEFTKVKLPPNRTKDGVKHLFEDKENNLWVATYDYLLKIKPHSTERTLFRELVYHQDTLKLTAIHTLQEDASHHIWIGTENGLIKWDPKTGRFSHFVNNPENHRSLIGNYILNIHEDKNKQLWICSSKGLSKVVTRGSHEHFEHYTRQHGLPNTFVYGALSDKDSKLWLSTNAGLSCYDPKQNTFKNYDTNDGLTNREFNSGAFHQSKDGELFFGGLGVLVSFFPDKLVENNHLPKVNVSSFQLFQNKVNLDSVFANQKGIRVKYKDYFSFFFSATDYNNPSRNRFAYKLEGLQDEWIYSENRFFGVADEKPGHYILKVKSSNNQGHWNEKDILSIPIYIEPPFWLTSWFYSLIAVTILAGGFLLYRYRVRLKVERALMLERIKIEENERVRKLAAQDLHDEFGNGLTRIAVLTELIKHKLDSDVTDARYLLGKINDNAQRLYQGTKDFVWTINPEHDNLYEIALRLKDFGDDVFEKTNTQFNVSGIIESYESITFPMGASRHLIMIFKEAMSNTLKYADAPQTHLSFESTPSEITIRWEDNGKGFDTSLPTQSHGLLNMQTRAQKIGGFVQIHSKIGSGSQIIFSIKSPNLGEWANPVF